MTEIASNDDASSLDYTSRVTFDAVAGTTYHIAIDCYRDEQIGTITLSGFPVGGFTVASAPQDTIARIGQYLDFRVLATGDSLQYLWSKDGVRLPWPADRATLELRPMIQSSVGNYSVEIRSASQSETFTWKLSAPMFPPVIESEPLDPVIRKGGVLVLSPGIIASDPVTYQWFHDDTEIPGAMERALRIENVSQANAGEYHLVATNEIGEARTRNFRVSIQDGAGLKWVQRLPNKDSMNYLGGVSHNGSIYLITEEGYLGHGKRVDSLRFSRFTAMRRPKGIAVHGTKLVIFGNESDFTSPLPQYNHLLTSEDGETWTRLMSDLPSGLPISDFASDGTTAVALVAGKIYHSTNLLNWSSIPQGTTENLQGLEFTNGVFLAIRENYTGASYWLSSPDGANWTERTDTDPNAIFRDGENLRSANGNFFISSSIPGATGYSKSSDGITWIHGIQGLEGSELFAYHNGRYITTSGRTSVDGITWKANFASVASGGGTAFFINDGQIVRAGYQSRSVISSESITEIPAIQDPWPVRYGNYEVHGSLIFARQGKQISENGIAWELAKFSMEGENRTIFPILLSHDGTDYWTFANDQLPTGTTYLFRGPNPSSMRRIEVPFQLPNILHDRLHARGNHVLLAGPEFRTSPNKGATWTTIPNSQDYLGSGLSMATASGFILAKAESALVSLNGGVSWQTKSLFFQGHRSAPVLEQIVQQGGETIILDSEGYLLRSVDDGGSWSRIDLGEAGWKAVEHLDGSIYVLHQDGRVAMTTDRENFTIDGTLSVEGTGVDLTAFNGALFATVSLANGKAALFQGGAIAETDLHIALSGIREGSIFEPGTTLDLRWSGSTSLGEFSSARIFLNGEEIPEMPDAEGGFSIVTPGPGLHTLTITGSSQTGLTTSETIHFFSRSKPMRVVTAIGTDVIKDQKWFSGALYLAMQDGRILRTGDGSNWDLALHLPEVPRAIATTAELVAIITDRALYLSYDGIVWETLSHSGISPDFYNFASSHVTIRSTGGLLVANPSDTRYSENGRDWKIVPVSNGANTTFATYFKGLWISRELREEATLSIDGSSAVLASPALGFLPEVWAADENTMVMASAQALHRSRDGETWQEVGPRIQYPRKLELVDGYFFLTLGQTGPENYMVSRDGEEWLLADRIPDRITNGIWRDGSETSLDGVIWNTADPDSEAGIPAPLETGRVNDTDPHPTNVSLAFQRDGFPDVPVDIKSLHAPVTGWEYGSFHATSSLVADDGTWYAFQRNPAKVAVRSPEGNWSAPRSITEIPTAHHNGLFYKKSGGFSFLTSPDLTTWTNRSLTVSTTDDVFISRMVKFSDGIYFLTRRNLHKTTDATSFRTIYKGADFDENDLGAIGEFQNKLVRVGSFGPNRIQIYDRTTDTWSLPPAYFSNGFRNQGYVFEQNNRFHVLNDGTEYSTADFTDWESTSINVIGNSFPSLDESHPTAAQSSLVFNRRDPQIFTLDASGVWLEEPEISEILQLNTLEEKAVRHGTFSTWIESDDDVGVAIDNLSYEEIALNSPITVTTRITATGPTDFTPETGSALRLWALPDGVNDYKKRIELAVVPLDGLTVESGTPQFITRTVQLPDSANPGKFSIAAEMVRPGFSFDDIPTNNLAKSSEILDLPARILNLTSLGSGTINRDNVGVVYANGALVSMTASAGKGASFSGWSGDSITSLSQITLRMDSDKTIAANFTSTVGLQISQKGAGFVSGQSSNGLYPDGTNATMTAVPHPGWTFAGWSGAASGMNPSVNILIDQPKTLNARFEISFESWKESHFKGLLSDVSISGDSVDADGDGKSNWIEYLHGSDPLDSKSDGTVSVLFTDDYLSVIFLRNSGSQGGSISPQGSIDMSDWTSYPVQERILATDAGIETVEARLPRTGKDRAFLRMKYSTD